MAWFAEFRRRRAAKAYVYKLGPWLRRAYGASRTYTAGQIERGAHELKLDPRFIVFGYAVFLDAAAFQSAVGPLPEPPTLEEARAALRRALGGPPQFDPAHAGFGDGDDLAVDAQSLGAHGTAHHGGGHGGHDGGSHGH
jgi:hypothetical protein